jgi:hypothetical protein
MHPSCTSCILFIAKLESGVGWDSLRPIDGFTSDPDAAWLIKGNWGDTAIHSTYYAGSSKVKENNGYTFILIFCFAPLLFRSSVQTKHTR